MNSNKAAQIHSKHTTHTHTTWTYTTHTHIYILIYMYIKTILTVKKIYLSKKCINNSMVPAFLAVRISLLYSCKICWKKIYLLGAYYIIYISKLFRIHHIHRINIFHMFHFWWVVWTPLKDMSQLGWWHSQYMGKCSKPQTKWCSLMWWQYHQIQCSGSVNCGTFQWWNQYVPNHQPDISLTIINHY